MLGDSFEDSVSVIIPTYNRAEFLTRCIQSVLAQTHKPLEVIVVDDGSTDGTAKVCHEFSDQVRYLYQENAGVAAARNCGFSEARGRWVALLDSDDYWEPHKLRVTLAALAAVPGAQFAISGLRALDDRGRPLPTPQSYSRVFPVFDRGRLPPESFFASALERTRITVDGETHEIYHGDAFELFFHGNFGLPSSCVIQRELAMKNGGFDVTFSFAEDTEYFHRLAAHAPIVVIMTPLVDYTFGQPNAMTAPHNATAMIEGAIRAQGLCAALRAPLTRSQAEAYAAGQRHLFRRLAYARLTLLDGSGARAALRQLRDVEPTGSLLFSLGLFLLSLAPRSVLRFAHRLKRAARRF
jgi:GT2 family glycosyltransferase